jgi:hypothetical protein
MLGGSREQAARSTADAKSASDNMRIGHGFCADALGPPMAGSDDALRQILR